MNDRGVDMLSDDPFSVPGSDPIQQVPYERQIALQGNEDVVAVRQATREAAARAGFGAVDQVCLSIIAAGLARWIVNNIGPARLSIAEVDDRVTFYALAAPMAGATSQLLRLRGQSYLDDLVIEETDDGLLVSFKKRAGGVSDNAAVA